MLNLPASLGVAVTYASHAEVKIVRREIKEGMYSACTYVLANTIVQLPWMAALALTALIPAGYGIGNFPWSQFVGSWAVMILALFVCENLAQVQLRLFVKRVRVHAHACVYVYVYVYMRLCACGRVMTCAFGI